jgi:phosphatidylglycerophosphate synthase
MDYFTERERRYQYRFRRKRDHWFAPLTGWLERLGVSPSHVTLAGVAALVAGAAIPPSLGWLAALCIALYVFADSVDGPLARRTGRAHTGGAVLEIAADQLGVILLPAAATWHLGANGAAMACFAGFYVAFIAVVVYANSIRLRLHTHLRVKYPFYILYAVSMFIDRDLVTHFCAVFAAYYAVEVAWTTGKLYMHYRPD